MVLDKKIIKVFISKIYFSLCALDTFRQGTGTIWTIIKEGHIRIIPAKFGKKPAISLWGDVLWSNFWRWTTQDGHQMMAQVSSQCVYSKQYGPLGVESVCHQTFCWSWCGYKLFAKVISRQHELPLSRKELKVKWTDFGLGPMKSGKIMKFYLKLGKSNCDVISKQK